jgi:biopolymer transport protein ExbD
MAMATHDVTDTNVMGDINVTPMVDVMLVLLIIFMVVTPAITAGFTAKLPQGAHLKQRETKEDRTVLGISGEGDYYLNKKIVPGCKLVERQGAGKTACEAQLLVLLQQDYGKHPQDHVLFLRADQSRPYQEVMDVMGLAKRSGAAMVAAVTEQTPGTNTQLETATD